MEGADASSTITFKVLLVGDSGTGKSSILTRFTDNKFEPDHAATIGVDFKVKVMDVDNRTVKLTIWVRQTPPGQRSHEGFAHGAVLIMHHWDDCWLSTTGHGRAGTISDAHVVLLSRRPGRHLWYATCAQRSGERPRGPFRGLTVLFVACSHGARPLQYTTYAAATRLRTWTHGSRSWRRTRHPPTL